MVTKKEAKEILECGEYMHKNRERFLTLQKNMTSLEKERKILACEPEMEPRPYIMNCNCDCKDAVKTIEDTVDTALWLLVALVIIAIFTFLKVM